MILKTKGMVEIYSILQMVFWQSFFQFLGKFNETHKAVHRDSKEGAHQVWRSWLPYELRYGKMWNYLCELRNSFQYIQYPFVEQRFYIVLQTLQYQMSSVQLPETGSSISSIQLQSRAEIPCCSTSLPVSDVSSTVAWSGDIMLESPF